MKFEIIITKRETLITDVEADSYEQAVEKAEKLSEGKIYGDFDTEVEVSELG